MGVAVRGSRQRWLGGKKSRPLRPTIERRQQVNPPQITSADRARGFVELDLQMRDGTRQSVRVHALDHAEFLAALHCRTTPSHVYMVAKAIRETPDHVAEQLSHLAILRVLETLAVFDCGQEEGAKLADQAVQIALSKQDHG